MGELFVAYDCRKGFFFQIWSHVLTSVEIVKTENIIDIISSLALVISELFFIV